MKYSSLEIRNAGSNSETAKCVLPDNATLSEVCQRVDLDTTPFLLVENRQGDLIGIVESSLIRKRLSATNTVERQRWMEMDLGSALQWKISPTSPRLPSTAYNTVPISCTAVSSEAGVMALVSDQDVFVSWHAVRESLSEAMVDPVSMLPNRLVFERRLNEDLDRAGREKKSIGVVLYDLDNFKGVNDTHGHAVGDAALSAVGHKLKSQLRSYDVLARYGGDEFASICSACRPGEIDIPLRRIQASLADGFKTTSIQLPPITLSIGAVVVHRIKSSITVDDIVELADISLYKAKEHGRNCAFKMELADETDSCEPKLVTFDADQSTQVNESTDSAIAPIPIRIVDAIPSITPMQ